MNEKWEPIGGDNNAYVRTERLRVPNGWLVRSCHIGDGCSVHTVFISDPRHTWADPNWATKIENNQRNRRRAVLGDDEDEG